MRIYPINLPNWHWWMILGWAIKLTGPQITSKGSFTRRQNHSKLVRFKKQSKIFSFLKPYNLAHFLPYCKLLFSRKTQKLLATIKLHLPVIYWLVILCNTSLWSVWKPLTIIVTLWGALLQSESCCLRLTFYSLRVVYTKQPKTVQFLLSDWFCLAVSPIFVSIQPTDITLRREIGKFLSQNRSQSLAKLDRQPCKISRTWQKSEAPLFL